ncbi:MAG: hypothetical protein OXQ29_05295 [Rhodospirillaceae bacterium]|nr:hypothetical protein [Rhodospirillaceae bacterium]
MPTDDNQQTPILISDRDIDLIRLRVLEVLRSERHVYWRWLGGLAISVAIAFIGLVFRTEHISAGRPTINDLGTPFNAISRLQILGLDFGESFGQVELFYTYPETDDSNIRTPTIQFTVYDGIISWSSDEIIVEPLASQRNQIRKSLGISSEEPVPETIVPYIRVRRADGLRSPLW